MSDHTEHGTTISAAALAARLAAHVNLADAVRAWKSARDAVRAAQDVPAMEAALDTGHAAARALVAALDALDKAEL